MKKLHIYLMTVLVVMMALVMAIVFTGCGLTETPDGGVGGENGGENSDTPVVESKGLDFEKIEDTETYAVVGLGNCKDAKVVIPATYRNKPVVAINSTAFAENCGSVTEIYVPDSVKTIQNGAFNGCTALQKLTIPVLRGKIGAYFGGANTSLPSTLKTIILTTMSVVPEYSFEDCASLEEIEFPTNATELGWACLKGCNSLKKLKTPFVGTSYMLVDGGTKWEIPFEVSLTSSKKGYRPHLANFWGGFVFKKFDYGDSFKTSTELVPSTLTSLTITNGFVSDYACMATDSLNEVVVEGETTSVKMGIGHNAFYSSSIESFTMTSKGVVIGNGAFASSDIISVALPSTVKEIGEKAFSTCSSLKNFEIPTGVTSIGASAFMNCGALVSIAIPAGVTSIGESAFRNCDALVSITIPKDVATIEKYAFESCGSLASVTIFNGVTSIGESAFAYCKSLTSIVIPDSVKMIGSKAFVFAGLKSVVFENTVGWRYGAADDGRINAEVIADSKKMATYLTADTGWPSSYYAWTRG